MSDNNQGGGGQQEKAPRTLADVKKQIAGSFNKARMEEAKRKIQDAMKEQETHRAAIAKLDEKITQIWEDYQTGTSSDS